LTAAINSDGETELTVCSGAAALIQEIGAKEVRRTTTVTPATRIAALRIMDLHCVLAQGAASRPPKKVDGD